MRNILNYFKKEKKLCIEFLILGTLTTILSFLEPKLTANMVTAITNTNLNSLTFYAIMVAIVACSIAIVRFLIRTTAVKIRTRVGKTLETDLCNKALSIKSCFMNDFKSGELTEITKSNSAEFTGLFQEAIMYIFSIITSAMVAAYVIILSWQSALLFGIFLSVIMLLQKLSLKKEKSNSEESKNENDSAKSLMNQMYNGALEIKVLYLKRALFDKYNDLLENEIQAKEAKENAKSSNRMFVNISFEIYALLYVLLSVFLMKQTKMEIATFVTIYMYKSYLYNLIFNVAELRSDLSEMKVLAERISKLLKIEDFKLEKFGNLEGSTSNNHYIEMNNLSFSYGEGINVLENTSLKYEEGKFYGVVGESGSAKTTLIKLLSRQLEPTEGSLKLDGVDYSEYSETGFTNLVALASQEPFVFSFSIRDNLLMVKHNATESEIWKALEDAQCIDFVKNLPNGIDTVLKETLNISGGQKQRLSLARLFLKDTPIILMDEATSALDNRTQAEITSLIRKKVSESAKICIAIAHRIEAIENADQIVFLQNGKIAGVGTHKELLQNSDYRKLLNK